MLGYNYKLDDRVEEKTWINSMYELDFSFFFYAYAVLYCFTIVYECVGSYKWLHFATNQMQTFRLLFPFCLHISSMMNRETMLSHLG